MRAALEGHVPGERPTLERIRAEVGAFTSADDGAGEPPGERARGGRRGRRRA
jgi:5-methyltetrahydrofolate--homocysteine methyltransferase